MVETVKGLRSQNDSTTVKRKQGREVTKRATGVTASLSPTANRVQSYTGGVRPDIDQNAFALAKALTSLSPALSKFGTTQTNASILQQKTTDKNILEAADYHIDLIKAEAGSGVVSQVQIGEALPEASATVTAKLASVMGTQYAEDLFNPILEQIETDDNLKLDTANRGAFMAKFMEEADGVSDDPFYVAGLKAGLESVISKNETRWLKDTANYQREVLAEGFKDDIISTITNGGDLELLDSVAKETSPFTNLQRNAMVVKTVTDLAIEGRDPNLLDSIPDRFLNAEDKRGLALAKQQIRTASYSEWNQARIQSEFAEKQIYEERQLGIITEFIENGRVDATVYRDDPQLFNYAQSFGTRERVDPMSSAVNISRLRNGILKGALTGENGSLADLGFEGELTADNIYAHLLSSEMYNPEDVQKIAPEIAKLLEGQAVLQDPVVREAITTYLRPQLNAMRNSPNEEIQQMISGGTMETDVLDFYEDEILSEFTAHYEDTGDWPKGVERNRIVREVRKEAIEVMKDLTNISNIGKTPPEAIETVKGAAKTWNPATGKME